jgi:hypothetical protein
MWSEPNQEKDADDVNPIQIDSHYPSIVSSFGDRAFSQSAQSISSVWIFPIFGGRGNFAAHLFCAKAEGECEIGGINR